MSVSGVRFGTVEDVEAFHKAADHILLHRERNLEVHVIWCGNPLHMLLQVAGRLAQQLWRMANGADVGAKQRRYPTIFQTIDRKPSQTTL